MDLRGCLENMLSHRAVALVDHLFARSRGGHRGGRRAGFGCRARAFWSPWARATAPAPRGSNRSRRIWPSTASYTRLARRGAMLAAQRRLSSIEKGPSAWEQCYGAVESCCVQWYELSRCRATFLSPCPRGWSWCSGRARPSLESTPVCVLLAPTHRAQPRAGGPRAELKHARVPAMWHEPGGAWRAALAVSPTYFGSPPEVMLQANSAVDLGVKEVGNRMSAPVSQTRHPRDAPDGRTLHADLPTELTISRLCLLNLHAEVVPGTSFQHILHTHPPHT